MHSLPSKTGWCTAEAFTHAVATGKPQYNWAVIIAGRDMDGRNPSCTRIQKTIDTGTNGVLRLGLGVEQYHVGD